MSIDAMARASTERARDTGATLGRMLGELRPFRSEIGLAFGLIVVSAFAQAAGPWLVGRAIDEDILGGDPAGLARTMLLLLGVYVAGSIAQRGQIGQVGLIGQRLLASLRMRLFEQFQHLPLGYFDRRPIGDLMSRSINDVETLNQLFSQGLTQLLGSLFGLVGILIAMLALNLELALVCFTIIPVMVLLTSLFASRARAAFRKTRETTGDVTAGLQEEIVGVRQAQAFNRTEANIERFRRQNAANRDANVQAVGITSGFGPTMDLLSTLATALVIGYGGYLVYRDALTVGLLAAFLIYVQQFFRPIQLISQVYTQLQSALAGAERIYAILDEPREPADAGERAEGNPVVILSEAKDLPHQTGGDGSANNSPVILSAAKDLRSGDARRSLAAPRMTGTASQPDAVAAHAGRIEFDRVTFAYETGRPVLHDVSFSIEPGQAVALVGPTGAGKTTIANLIPRFYDVTSGAVRVDDQDVRDVPRAALRAGIAMVLQEPFLFSGSIRDNIAYGRLDATDSEIEDAARAVEAHEFVVALPDGYGTVLGEGGAPLSQGQRQLVSFARAVLADPRILILDEATSSVDTRTEALIQQALTRLLAGRTSVVIAHRLSTIRRADVILAIEGGRIRERGTHDELLARGGLYADLYRRQSGGILPDPGIAR